MPGSQVATGMGEEERNKATQILAMERSVLTLTWWKFLFLLTGRRQQGLQGLHVNDELLVQGVGAAALRNICSENRYKPEGTGFHQEHWPLRLS